MIVPLVASNASELTSDIEAPTKACQLATVQQAVLAPVIAPTYPKTLGEHDITSISDEKGSISKADRKSVV
jgi:hypothetical protein